MILLYIYCVRKILNKEINYLNYYILIVNYELIEIITNLLTIQND